MKDAHHHLINWGIKKGYTIEVDCEGITEYKGKNYDEAVEASEACDVGAIYFIEGDEHIAWFSYVHEYERVPDEIISDWGVNVVTESWWADYLRHCKRYPINKHFSRSNN